MAVFSPWLSGRGCYEVVVDQAQRLNVTIDWRTHLRLGAPVTVATLGVAALWLWIAP